MEVLPAESTPPPRAGAFAPTCWSVVMLAGGSDEPATREALELLCRTYWPPVYARLRMRGHASHEAQDLTQEFFARMLRSNSFAGLSPEKGRFRSFLLAALKHFLINEWKRERALKRGGGVEVLNWDALDPALRDACEPLTGETPAMAYDRSWALTLLAKVRSRLRREHEAAGQGRRYEVLKGYLSEGDAPRAYGDSAALLGITESAVKSAVFKLRQRFGQLVRAEIARTVADEAEVEDELRELLRALRC